MKPLVVILSVADWAGSQFQVFRAVNYPWEDLGFQCRHITLFKHPFEFPTDVFISLFPPQPNECLTEPVRAVKSEQYAVVSDLLQKANLIHLWNTYPGDPALMSAGLPIDFNKVKVVTMTGSQYRVNHRNINIQIASMPKCRLTVQNPMLKFPDEIDSTFIPHAVDVILLNPQPKKKIVGTYRPNHKSAEKPFHEEKAKIKGVVEEFEGWSVDLDHSLPWKERMEKLAECSIFVQDLSPYIGYWGRSTLEACAFDVPCLQNYDYRVSSNSEGKLGEIPLVKVEWDTAEEELRKLIRDEKYREEVGRKSREWVKEHFYYPVIGRMYSDLYREVL